MDYNYYRNISTNNSNNKKINNERPPSYDLNSNQKRIISKIETSNKNIYRNIKEKRNDFSNPGLHSYNINKIKEEIYYSRTPNNKNKINPTENSKISNVISSPNQYKKVLNTNNNAVINSNKYNYNLSKDKNSNSNEIIKQINKPYLVTSDNTRDNKSKIKNNINSRPESANVPSSLRLQKRLNENNVLKNKGVSPVRNINNLKSNQSGSNSNSNINQNNTKLKSRNLTPNNKPNDNYTSPFTPYSQYQSKKINNKNNENPPLSNPLRQRPMSGIITPISRINNNNSNIQAKGIVKNSIVTKPNNKVELRDNYNLYNKRNFTPTPSNIKSNRYDIDTNKKNYMINISNNAIDNKRNEAFNKIPNVHNNNIPRSQNQNINMDIINSTPVINMKQPGKINHDFNNYYNQGKNLQNLYNLKSNNNQDLKNKIDNLKNNYSEKYANRYSYNDISSNNYRK